VERTEIVQGLLERHGQTFADEAGIHLTDAPKPLFRLLCLTVLLATRMRHSMGVDAARALGEAGLDTPEDVADHRDRVRETLTGAGYVRYDESKADQLAQSAAHCRDAYDGDLRRLRGTDDLADRLTEFTGIGEVGAEIFLREVQAVWPEVRPVFGRPGRSGAKAVGLPQDDGALADLVSGDDVARLAAALVRVDLDGDEDLEDG